VRPRLPTRSEIPRLRRDLTLLFALIALVLLLIPQVDPSLGPSWGSPNYHVPPILGSAVSLMTISTQATQTFHQSVTATQVTSSPWSVSAAPVSVPFPLASSANVSGYTLTLTGQGSGVTPQGNGTQSGSVLFNATLLSQILEYPTPAALTIRTVALWTSTGTTPAEGNYKVWYNGTQVVQDAYTATPAWNFNGTGYTLAYNLTAPAGVVYNQTQVFVPFPSNVSVNFTSLRGTIGSTKVNPIQATNVGVYLFVNGIAAGGYASLGLTFTPAPSTTGTVPVIVFSSYVAHANGSYSASGSYINGRTAAYAGIYLLQLRFPSPISPTTLQIRFGTTLLTNVSYSLSGSTITILPFAYATPAGSRVTVSLLFSFASGAPSYSIAGNSTFQFGPVSVSLFVILIVALVTVAGVDCLLWLVYGSVKPRRTVSPENPRGILPSNEVRLVIVVLAGIAFALMVTLLILAVQASGR
jgi:hypothetical protein